MLRPPDLLFYTRTSPNQEVKQLSFDLLVNKETVQIDYPPYTIRVSEEITITADAPE